MPTDTRGPAAIRRYGRRAISPAVTLAHLASTPRCRPLRGVTNPSIAVQDPPCQVGTTLMIPHHQHRHSSIRGGWGTLQSDLRALPEVPSGRPMGGQPPRLLARRGRSLSRRSWDVPLSPWVLSRPGSVRPIGVQLLHPPFNPWAFNSRTPRAPSGARFGCSPLTPRTLTFRARFGAIRYPHGC
jgi:hypothetical protein